MKPRNNGQLKNRIVSSKYSEKKDAGICQENGLEYGGGIQKLISDLCDAKK